ncbi:MAG: acyltransferase family protein, partial [Prevotella sp.]
GIRNFMLDRHLHIPICISVASWFLICLFNLNMIFFALFKICKGKMPAVAVCSCCIGAAGYFLGKEGTILPLWLDSAMTAAPFFLVGTFIRNNTSILECEYSRRMTRMAVAALLILLLIHGLDVLSGSAFVSYKDNYYEISMASLYVGGTCGFLLIFIISKYFKRIPVFSYIGKYSIVVLITHEIYLFFLRNVLYKLDIQQDNILISTAVFAIIILLELPTIKYGIKYCPYWFAQKDLLK